MLEKTFQKMIKEYADISKWILRSAGDKQKTSEYNEKRERKEELRDLLEEQVDKKILKKDDRGRYLMEGSILAGGKRRRTRRRKGRRSKKGVARKAQKKTRRRRRRGKKSKKH